MTTIHACLIIEPEHKNRSRLKEAIAAAPNFRSAIAVSSLEQARSIIEEQESFNVTFLSQRLPRESVSAFVAGAKQSFKGRDSAYVLLISGRVDNATISAALMQGTDGFLLEPYSLEALMEIAVLAERVRRERQEPRTKLALRLLANELRDQVGRLAVLKKKGYNAAISGRALEEMCSVLKELKPEVLAVYYETAIDVFTKAPPAAPARSSGALAQYRGTSSHLHGKLAMQALDRVKRAFAA